MRNEEVEEEEEDVREDNVPTMMFVPMNDGYLRARDGRRMTLVIRLYDDVDAGI